jgi:hypothetical protein
MPEQKKQRMERLILSGCRDMALNGEIGQVFLDILRRQRLRRFILFPDLQRFWDEQLN